MQSGSVLFARPGFGAAPGIAVDACLCGMLHRLRSSRQLEDACHSRLDVIWLMSGQTPDHSTIADFVCRHGRGLRRLIRDTWGVLIDAKLVKLSHVAIDGSKVEADAGKSSVRTEEKIRSWFIRCSKFRKPARPPASSFHPP